MRKKGTAISSNPHFRLTTPQTKTAKARPTSPRTAPDARPGTPGTISRSELAPCTSSPRTPRGFVPPEAIRHVAHVHTPNASSPSPTRSSHAESAGSPASFCASTAWNGFTGLNALPTLAAPMLTATATSGSNPSRRQSNNSTGTSAMISSCKFSNAPPRANTAHRIGMTRPRRSPSRSASQSTTRRNAPVASTTLKAPPTRKTKATTSAARTIPRGIAENVATIPAGRASTA